MYRPQPSCRTRRLASRDPIKRSRRSGDAQSRLRVPQEPNVSDVPGGRGKKWETSVVARVARAWARVREVSPLPPSFRKNDMFESCPKLFQHHAARCSKFATFLKKGDQLEKPFFSRFSSANPSKDPYNIDFIQCGAVLEQLKQLSRMSFAKKGRPTPPWAKGSVAPRRRGRRIRLRGKLLSLLSSETTVQVDFSDALRPGSRAIHGRAERASDGRKRM